jgi:hypothetical protein
MKTFAKEVSKTKGHKLQYSVCTLVTNLQEYHEMLDTFASSGFNNSFCEFLYIDNSAENQFDAFAGLNHFLTLVQGEYIILCHQDILLNFNNIDHLNSRINEMNLKFPDWAILGNAGTVHLKRNASKIANGKGNVFFEGPLPQEVKSLDENFLILKREANLSFSRNLNGFHLYGTDLCIIANVLGYKAYVIDFLLTHKSGGNPDESFYNLKKQLVDKYRKSFRGRFIRTTITRFYLSGSAIGSLLLNSYIGLKLASLFDKWK